MRTNTLYRLVSLHELYSNYIENVVIYHTVVRKIHVNDDICVPETLFRQIYFLQGGGSDFCSSFYGICAEYTGSGQTDRATGLFSVCFFVSLCYRMSSGENCSDVGC